MALTAIDTGTYSPHPVNAIMEQAFLRRAQQVCPYLIGSQPGTIVTTGGTNIVKWRRFEQETPTTSALSEITTAAYGQGRNADTPTNTDVTATVAKYGQFYIMTEEVDLYSISGTGMELMDILGESAGRSINMLARNELEDNATQRFAANVASKAAVHAVVVAGDLNRAINELTNNSARTFAPLSTGSTLIGTVPILSSYWGICHPDVAYNLTAITGFTSVEKYAGHVALVEGEFGYYPMAGRGVRFVMSEDASKDANAGAALSGADLNSTGASSADVYQIVIFGQNAMGTVGVGKRHTDGVYRAGDPGAFQIISHPKGSAGSGDPFNEISTVAWKAFFVAKLLNTNWSRSIQVAATNLTN